MKLTVFSLVLGMMFTILTFLSGATVKCFFTGCEPIYELNYKSIPFSILGVTFLVFGLIRLVKRHPISQKDSLTIKEYAQNEHDGA